MSLVSIILPTYNESRSILNLIKDIHKEIKEYPHEIVVMDDNSPDGTFELVNKAGLGYVRCFKRTSDRGLGQSIKDGILESKGDIVVIMDSDYNHNPQFLPFFIQSLSDFDVIMGSRFLYGGRGSNPRRHLLSWAFNIFIRALTDGRITDSLFGYVAIRREKLMEMDFDKIFFGFGEYGIRLTYWCQKYGHQILQVPTVIGDRIAGTAHGEVLKVFYTYTFCALKLVWRYGRINLKTDFNKTYVSKRKKSA